MKTIEQIVSGYRAKCLDGRDIGRLVDFVPEADLPKMDVKLKDEFVGKHVAIPLTREAVLDKLRDDVAFGFEKALNKRGISAGLMFEVVHMWNWILEEGLESPNEDEVYAQYGLPYFKATAVKYGFPNPIGDDVGNEYKYTAEAE